MPHLSSIHLIRGRPGRLLGAALTVAALAAAACRPGPGSNEGRGRLQRIELERIDAGAPLPEARPLASFQPGLEPELWETDAPMRGVAHLEGMFPDGPPALVVDHRGIKQLGRRIEIDPRKLDEIAFTLSCAGPQRVEAALFSEGREIARSAPVEVDATPEPARVALRLPETKEAACDRLVLHFSGAARRLGICEVDLLERPSFAWVAEALLDDLVGIGEETRRGSWLSTRNGLRGRAKKHSGSVLSFAFAQPLRNSRAGVLSVCARDSAGGEIRRRLELEGQRNPARWRDMRIPLDGLGDGEILCEFTLESANGPEVTCVVAEAGLLQVDAHPRPSVLLVTSDTHRSDHLGAAGMEVEVRTPALDTLAQRGVLFTDCYAPTNITNPSHGSLLTGVHPRDIGVLDNKTRVTEAATTIAEHFSEAGYRTWAVVSVYHLRHEFSGLGQGFDRVDGPARHTRRAEATLAVLNGWLEEESSAPVFAWVHLYDAHKPYEPPEEFDRMYYPRDRDPHDSALPELTVSTVSLQTQMPGLRDLNFPRAQYKGEISYLDAQLAPLLERPRFRRGITAFVADHGESLGRHGIWFGHAGLYPDSLHIPLILAWPGAPAGRRVDVPVMHTDLGRTLLDLAGLEGAEFPGVDLRRTLERADAQAGPRFALAADGMEASVTAGGFHLILHLRTHHEDVRAERRDRHQVELYDLRADSEGDRNLVEELPDRARRMRELLVQWLQDARPLGLTGSSSSDPVLLAELARLGYADVGRDGAGRASLWEDDGCERCLPFR